MQQSVLATEIVQLLIAAAVQLHTLDPRVLLQYAFRKPLQIQQCVLVMDPVRLQIPVHVVLLIQDQHAQIQCVIQKHQQM